MIAIIKIAFRNLIKNKQWSIPTGIAIFIAVGLVSGVGTMASTYLKTSQQAIIQTQGPSHIVAFNMDEKSINELKDIEQVKNIEALPVISYAKITDYSILNSRSPYVKLIDINESIFNQHSFVLTSGSYPLVEGEIALNEAFLYFTDLDLRVGDVIQLDIGSRMINNHETNSIYFDPNHEEFLIDQTKEFKITGFIMANNFAIKDYEDAGFISITKNLSHKDNQNIIMIELESPSANSVFIVENTLNQQNIEFQRTTLLTTFYTGISSMKESPMYILTLGAILLGLLIMFASILVIRNAYSINQRYLVKQLGILDAVGATQTQKLVALLTQSLIFSVIAIPAGLMVGYMSAFVILTHFRRALSETVFYSEVVIHFYPQLIWFIVIGSFIIIVFTSIFPALKISRLSSIETIKYFDRDIEKYGHVKSPTSFKNIETRLAFVNFRRERKYYRSLTLSLIISIVLIGTSVIVVNAQQRTLDYSRKDIVYTYNANQIEDGRLRNIVTQLKESPITSHAGLWNTYYLYVDSTHPSLDENIINQGIYFEVNVVDDDYCLDVLESEFEGFECNQQALYVDHLETEYLTLDNKLIKINGPMFNEPPAQLQINVMDRTFNLDFEANDYFYSNNPSEIEPAFYYSRSTFNRLSNPFVNYLKEGHAATVYEIFMNSQNNAEAMSTFQNVLAQNSIENNTELTNIKSQNLLIIQVTRFFALLSFSLIILITLIAISNVVNSVNHSLNMRRKETAILISNGLTIPSFIKIIILETLWFGVSAVLIGIPISMLISVAIAQLLEIHIQSLFSQALIMILISFLLVLVMMILVIVINIWTLKKQDIHQLSQQ